MNISRNIDRIMALDGVLAVRVIDVDSQQLTERYNTAELTRREVLFTLGHKMARAYELIDKDTDDGSEDIRVEWRGIKILVQNHGDEIVALAHPRGHAIAKSIQRVLRRASAGKGCYGAKTAAA